ncbi:MAG: 50S ribosomal protein L3 [Bdellovibrio sp.]|nr:50S ribosomal protein L3 [Bdellovibrio sp.]
MSENVENASENKQDINTSGTEATPTTTQGRSHAVLTQGLGGILGVKAGMTQVFNADGRSMAVTVIDLKPSVITQIKTNKDNDYQAIQVGIIDKNAAHTSLSEQGHAKKAGATGFYHYQEFRLPKDANLEGLAVGQVLTSDFIKAGDLVDVSSRSKGKGFQGGMKRYNMSGGHKTHGASLSHRSLGSIGNRADPGRCFKNKKMPGHMGHEKISVQNVQVVKVDKDNGLLLINGSVPGSRSTVVSIRKAVKTIKK